MNNWLWSFLAFPLKINFPEPHEFRVNSEIKDFAKKKKKKKKINELSKSHASYALQTKQSLAFEKSAGSKNNNNHALLKSYLIL